MVALLALVMVLLWGSWIPIAEALGRVSPHRKTLWIAVGNLLAAAVVLGIEGGDVSIGWRVFWLPFAGGVVWTLGSYTALRAVADLGVARAGGTWSPLNIVVSFVWGATLFHELRGFAPGHFAVLGVSLALVLMGVLLVVGARDVEALAVVVGPGEATGVALRPDRGRAPGGFVWATAAGFLWGSYFIPAQWAQVPSQVGNLPLAVGMFVTALALTFAARESRRSAPGWAAGWCWPERCSGWAT